MRQALLALLSLALAACAQMAIQRPLKPGAGFEGPRILSDAFISFDGARLGLSSWAPPPGDSPWAVIVGLHGMDDYGNAFHLAGPYWAKLGIATYSYDMRGFGRSPERGVWGGDVLFVEDLRTMVALARQRYPRAVIAVAGESLGGAVAIEAFASSSPPAADRLILLAPAVWGWSSQPLAYKLALQAAARIAPSNVFTPPSFVTSHISASDNRAELIAMGKDPLMIWGARADTLFGLVTTMQRASDEIGDLKIQALYMLGAHDEIIPLEPSLKAASRLPAGDRTAWYPQGWHLLLRDLQAKSVWEDVAAFLRDPKAPLPSGAGPIPPPGSPAARIAER
jgi:acylglycerol lipase